MPIYKLNLLAKEKVAQNTIVFRFSKPENFHFIPGQYGGFTLTNTQITDTGGMTRRFSLLSAPQDVDIAIATRIQNSDFKQALNQMPIGHDIKFAGPSGNFILHEDIKCPAVFIAGGIGITPFYSMIRDSLHRDIHRPIYLFYGNEALADAAFFAELSHLSHHHPYFKFIPTLNKPEKNWSGEKGFVTADLLKKHLPDIHQPHYYICGSPLMVSALQQTVFDMSVNEEQIKVEDFPGY